MFEDDEENDKETKENAKPSAATEAEKDDNVEIEESEDVKEGEEGTKNTKTEETTPAKTSSLAQEKESAPAEPVEPVKRLDFTLMDSLTSFLYSEDDPLPILCGYFNKIMQQLLIKQKNNTLEYLLVEQNGKIFHGLLKHLQHHSLALLLISLLEIQIQPNQDKKDKARVAWEASEGSDIDNEETAEGELTAEQKHMQSVLKEKGTYVVNFLIE